MKKVLIVLLFGALFLTGCKSISFKYKVDGDNVVLQGIENNIEKMEKLVIPNMYQGKKVVGIDNDAFKGFDCDRLILPSTLEKIGVNAFVGNPFEKLYFDGSVEKWCNIDFGDNWISGTEEFFLRNDSNKYYLVEDITFPENIKAIPNYSFIYFLSVRKYCLHKGITKIGKYAFWTNDDKKSLYYTGTLSDWCKIEFGFNWNDCFEHLYINGEELVDLVVPDDITELNRYSFSGLSCLRTITIPKSIEYIGECTFDICRNVESFYYVGSVIEWGKIIIAENHVFFRVPIEYLNR